MGRSATRAATIAIVAIAASSNRTRACRKRNEEKKPEKKRTNGEQDSGDDIVLREIAGSGALGGEWHEARKASKRLRYAAEAAAPVLRKPA